MSEVEEDAKAQSASAVDELRQQLAKTMEASDHYQQHAEALQVRLDEITKDQISLEEQVHDKDSKFLALQDELMESRRQRRELEKIHDDEREKLLAERQQQSSREEELQIIIQRLNETIKQKEMRMTVDGGRPASLSRSCISPLHSLHTIHADVEQRVFEIQLLQSWTQGKLPLRLNVPHPEIIRNYSFKRTK